MKKITLETAVCGAYEAKISINEETGRVSIYINDDEINRIELASFIGYHNAASFCQMLYSLSGTYWWSDELSLEIMSQYLKGRGYDCR
jgi:hypothetical protein